MKRYNGGVSGVDGWFKQPHLNRVRLIRLWARARLHTCGARGNQCTQAKPAVTTRSVSVLTSQYWPPSLHSTNTQLCNKQWVKKFKFRNCVWLHAVSTVVENNQILSLHLTKRAWGIEESGSSMTRDFIATCEQANNEAEWGLQRHCRVMRSRSFYSHKWNCFPYGMTAHSMHIRAPFMVRTVSHTFL